MNKNRKNNSSMLTIVLIIAGVYLIGSSIFKNNTTKTTDTWSTKFATAEERVSFYLEYVACPTEVSDTIFHIIYTDNSKKFVSTESDWEISAIVKMNNEQCDDWISGFNKIDISEINFEWWNDLESDDFITHSEPDCYKAEGYEIYLVVYREEGIIMQYFYNLPE